MKKFSVSTCVVLWLLTSLAHGQESEIPRTPDGRPDLQGIWTNATQTPLQRPSEFGTQGSLNEQEAAELEASWRNRIQRASAPSDPNRAPPTDGNADLGYNNFWVDRGTNVIELGGEYRTSIIVDPADGRIPVLEGRPQNDLRSQFRGMPGIDPYHGPETRPLGERCLLSFGSSSGPPMLPVMYNNNYQIVQTPEYIMILVEMVHDARIVRIDQNHFDTNFEKWMGDSVGYWEGDSLVVKTRDFHPQQSYRGSSEQLVVTERFELLATDKIKYSFTMDDSLTYRSSWSGEVAMNRRPAGDRMYEYACHEGNYAFPGILGGARRLEVEAENR